MIDTLKKEKTLVDTNNTRKEYFKKNIKEKEKRFNIIEKYIINESMKF